MIRLSYLFDPLCGWCYGASPVLEKLEAMDDVTIELVPTGLFADGGAFPMNAAFAEHAWEADVRIAQLSGQRFTEAYRLNVLNNRASRVDSGPATLALTAVRLASPRREPDALRAIQHVRYVDGRDNGNPAVIADVLVALGLDGVAARFNTPDEELLSANRARIEAGRAEMHRFGAQGVPTLIVGNDRSRRLVSTNTLFGSFEKLVASLSAT